MMKKVIRIVLLGTTGWGIGGFFASFYHSNSMVPLMYILIVILSLGFILLSEKP